MNRNLALYTKTLLHQLSTVVEALPLKSYQKELYSLSGSSIGQHVRHIIEFYQCLLAAEKTNVLDYDNRSRNKLIEENNIFASNCIDEIVKAFYAIDLSRKITMNVCYDDAGTTLLVDTTIERELIYNIEHSVHHMAIIKIGIKELTPHFEVPADFGVAISTIKHQAHVHRHVLTQD
jgi:hypothetical protein